MLRAKRLVAGRLPVGGALGLLVLAASCGDLFHGTSWSSQCEEDPSRDGCPVAATTVGTGVGAGGGGGVAGDGGAGGAGTGGSGGAPCATKEDCATDADDDCDGVKNQGCPPTAYAFDKATIDGGNLGDELHNLAASGSQADYTGFAIFALGQLTDGMKGVDGVADNLGNGDGYEWVCWPDATDAIVFDFGVTRDIESVTVGASNTGLYVYEPSSISVSFGDDPTVFGAANTFSLVEGTLPQIPEGKRGDLPLAVRGTGRYVKVELVRNDNGGAPCLDEIALE